MRLLLAVLSTVTLTAFVATSARGANVSDARLDAVVSEIAGTPISVLCETDATAWAQTVQGFPFLRDDSGNPITDPTILLGFTIVGSPRVWLSPKICLELRWDLHDADPRMPTLNPGAALLTLLHESEHLRGIHDEQEADCAALVLVPHYTTTLLGIPQTVTTAHTVTHVKRVRVHGRWVKRTVRVTVKTVGPNPSYVAVQSEARAFTTGCP